MYALYDYRYVIACSSMPLEFTREFRRLARGRVTSTYDRRTGAKDPVPAETQCRRVAEVLAGFEVLRAGGYALQMPRNFSSKHLRFLISLWSVQQLTSQEGGRETRALAPVFIMDRKARAHCPAQYASYHRCIECPE